MPVGTSLPNPVRLALFTRFPVAGQAKTRLIPVVGADGAAAVHKKLAERTVDVMRQSRGKIEIHYIGADGQDFEDWLGDGVQYVEQAAGDLTAKLTAALDSAPVIFFGSDTPDLEVQHVEMAIDALRKHDVVIGPAEDGGYYLIGMRQAVPSLLENISWSTNTVFSETLESAERENLTVKQLETLSDCDTPEDLSRWPWLTA